jgi:hypothetical protein
MALLEVIAFRALVISSRCYANSLHSGESSEPPAGIRSTLFRPRDRLGYFGFSYLAQRKI